MNSTARRVPRITGLPARISGSTTMCSNNGIPTVYCGKIRFGRSRESACFVNGASETVRSDLLVASLGARKDTLDPTAGPACDVSHDIGGQKFRYRVGLKPHAFARTVPINPCVCNETARNVSITGSQYPKLALRNFSIRR